MMRNHTLDSITPIDFRPDHTGNPSSFEFRDLKHPLMLHEEVNDELKGRTNLRKRLGLILQHLAAHGRTSIVKGCVGDNQGWRRSPLGGNGGMQFYLWWTPQGSRQASRLDGNSENAHNTIWVRAARHHDDHAPLTIGSDSDYYSLNQKDMAADDETFVSSPDTERQSRFVKGDKPVRIVHGHPGSGKTTALWKAIEARDNQSVLYVSWSRELISMAEERLSTFAPTGVAVTALNFLSLMGEIRGRDVERITYDRSRAVFDDALKRTRIGPAEMGAWATHTDALYAEIRAVLLGRAIPSDPSSTYIELNTESKSEDTIKGDRRLARLADSKYLRIRGNRKGIGEAAAKCLLSIAERLERHSALDLEKAFPELVAATDSIESLRRDELPQQFADLDRIAVDEVQDLTLIETAVAVELCRAIARRRGRAPWLLLAGDEGQTVRPSGFEWGLLKRLIGKRLVPAKNFLLDATLRSPERIERVIERATRLYKDAKLERWRRPADQRNESGGDPTDAQLFYVDAPSREEAIRLLERLDGIADLAVVTPESHAPKWLPEDLLNIALTPAIVKGLEYQTVCVLEPGRTLMRLHAEIDQNDKAPELETHSRRAAIDRLRVAISRATENLAFIEVSPDEVTRASSRELLGDAATYSPDDLIEYLATSDMQAEVIVPQLINEVRRLIDNAPGPAWHKAGQAVHLLGEPDSPEAVSDTIIRTDAHMTLVSTAARLLVDGLPDRVDRRQVVEQAENSLGHMGEERFGEAFRRLDEWTIERTTAPFALLDATLSTESGGTWMKDALTPVLQTIRESIERYSSDADVASSFAGDVEGWLRVVAYSDDIGEKAERLRANAASALLSTGNIELAEPILEKLQDEHARKLLIDGANAMLGSGDIEKAGPIIARVRPEDLLLSALYNEKLERWEDASELYERAGAIADAKRVREIGVRTHFDRGTVHLRDGSLEKAMDDFTSVIRMDPNHAEAYCNRGDAHAEKGDYDRAIADCTAAIQIDPRYCAAYVNRGNVHAWKGDHQRAITDCTAAIRIDPNHAEAYVRRGNAHAGKGDHQRAITDYTAAIQIDPRHYTAYTNRGSAHAGKGDYDRAITDYTAAIQIDPRHYAAYTNRGSVHVVKGDHQRAITDYTDAIRIDPNHAEAYVGRGDAHVLKGDQQRAEADYTAAIRVDPNYAEAYVRRGYAHAAKGDYDRADADYAEYERISRRL